MIEVRELNSKKISNLKKKQDKIFEKYSFDENMDKINWTKIRKIINGAVRIIKLPSGFHLKTYKKGKMRFEFITPKKKTNENIILYFHGGGFVTGSAILSRDFTIALSDITGSCVCSVDYPLAPENKIVECYDIISSIYDLLTIRYPNSNIILSGTSAGGCLALGLAEKLIRDKKKLPSALILNSPLLDMTGKYKIVNELNDGIVKPGCKKGMAKLFLGKYKKSNYLASPLLYSNRYLPRCMISIDNNETLFTDSYVLYNKYIENDIECNLVIYKNAFHGFQKLGKKTKETIELLHMINDFINKSQV